MYVEACGLDSVYADNTILAPALYSQYQVT